MDQSEAERMTTIGAYLELASRRNLPLATLDTRLAEGCRAMGVETVI